MDESHVSVAIFGGRSAHLVGHDADRLNAVVDLASADLHNSAGVGVPGGSVNADAERSGGGHVRCHVVLRHIRLG